MIGEVLMPMIVGKNVSRSLSKLSVNAKQNYAEFKYRSFAKFDFYTNASDSVRKPFLTKLLKNSIWKWRKETELSFS